MTLVDQGLSVNNASQLAGVSRSALYYKPRPRTVAPKPGVVEAVRQQCMGRVAYGYRRITAMLRRKGMRVNKKAVQRVMRLNGWLKPFHKRYRTRTGQTLPRPTHPDEYWQADMTKIWCGKDGWAYLFNVLDCCTREWLGYNFTQTCATSDNEPSITMALENHAPKTMQIIGLRFQTDNGGQYTSRRFEAFLKQCGFEHETIRKKTPEDNAYIESFHATLKVEYIWSHEFESFQHAQSVIQAAFVDYNHERIHSALGYKTPRECYEEMLKKVSLQN
ncbi:MAG: IS3 family transposase [Candidatus Uhrbacteria bacterium]|nr:IS3 family transposase [Candidatus Uhrbacteria bacterium]